MLLKLLQDGFGSAMDLNCAEKILMVRIGLII